MTTLIEQIDYDGWANLRLTDTISQLELQAFKQTIASSFPSVHKTLVHIVWAEELWLERWQGRSFVPTLDPDGFPSVESVKAKLEEVHQKQIQFLKGLPSSASECVVAYTNFRGQKWEYTLRRMVAHLTHHSAYHRGQLVTLLRQMGLSPPSTDYLVFVDSKPVAGT